MGANLKNDPANGRSARKGGQIPAVLFQANLLGTRASRPL